MIGDPLDPTTWMDNWMEERLNTAKPSLFERQFGLQQSIDFKNQNHYSSCTTPNKRVKKK